MDNKTGLKSSFSISIQAHVISGILAETLALPLDTIKIRLMTQNYSAPSQVKYSGMFNCAVTIAKEEGILSLWKGYKAAVLRQSIFLSTRWYIYTEMKELQYFNSNSDTFTLMDLVTLGVVSALPAVLLSNPFDLIKVRMQGDKSKFTPERKGTINTSFQRSTNLKDTVRYRGVNEALVKISTQEGLKSLWIGAGLSWLKIAIITPIDFIVYTMIKEAVIRNGLSDDYTTHLLCGAISGCMTFFVTPIDFVKTRLMNALKGEYSGANDVFLRTLKNEGFETLFRGVVPGALRIALSHAITFSTFEQIRNFLKSSYDE
ncbi:unnamed protein product [Blepharisma stoltei]|uniref:Mitochondrial carrier protein n=1 Tax=Blepharisma stoltei TaxID=1481888 RepID=A0AAU9JQE5_9CILI|nr:unnamed protein product [Blepharisma stoltei]